jgi:hypothetical protein
MSRFRDVKERLSNEPDFGGAVFLYWLARQISITATQNSNMTGYRGYNSHIVWYADRRLTAQSANSGEWWLRSANGHKPEVAIHNFKDQFLV